MRITSKGQVTIPIDIREALGFLANTEVEFIVRNNELYVKRKESQRRGSQLIQHMKGRGNVRMSTDEIMALARGR